MRRAVVRGVGVWTLSWLIACSSEHRPPPGAEDAGSDAEVVDSGAQDSDGDGLLDAVERSIGLPLDTDGDGQEDYLDPDDDGDGIPTKDELNRDSDRDGIPDRMDEDDDGDGIPTEEELAGGKPVDGDGDGTPDYLEPKPPEPIDGGTIEMCAQSNAMADLRKKPVDILFIIDNSSSMASEIQSVQASVNDNFAKIIGGSGIDYRVIMLADFGHYGAPNDDVHSICVTGDLNPLQSCPTSQSDPLYAQKPKLNDPRFFHYDPDGSAHDKSSSVGSKNSLCRALEWYGKPDPFMLTSQGYKQWLRKDALKVFVEVTDDRADCSLDLNGDGTVDYRFDDSQHDPQNANDTLGEYQAKLFDKALRALSEEQFGSDSARKYVWHSIVGLPSKPAPMQNEPYTASEPIQAAKCSSAEAPGRAYEALSRMTDGLRFPICAADAAVGTGELDGFDAIFRRIAQGVVEGSKVACDFAVPQPPMGAALDRKTVEVVYTPSTGDKKPVSFREVADKAGCGTQSSDFYFNGDRIELCASACTRVQSDSMAAVGVRFGCSLPPRDPPPPATPDGPDLQ
jgi:hypothetical protein